jgi:hypothetical protein
MLDFLKIANARIILNSIAFRRPTHIIDPTLAQQDLAATATKVMLGDGTFQSFSNSEHQTTFWNISQQ